MILRWSTPSALLATALASLVGLSSSQTYTACNPLFASTSLPYTTSALLPLLTSPQPPPACPANPALGGSMSADFTSGPNDMFPAILSGDKLTYTSDGAQFQVSGSGNSPTLASNFYIMFGRVSVTMKSAPGVGIVSSVVLQSDDLDEIDWEWLGGDNSQVQSNYFGKGNTNTYDRAAFIPVDNPQGTEHTYTIDWTSQSITWSIDGAVKRVLPVASSSGGGQYYPQTPMQIKLGLWSGGDPSNPPGTIQWAGGYTDYSQGPFNMFVRSISIQDYSTGSSYYYSDNSGSYTSIRSNGGTIGIDANGGTGSSNVDYVAPTLTDIPINNGIPNSYSTGTAVTRTPYVAPTSAEEYWAGTGFRVSSAICSRVYCYFCPYFFIRFD
ncbi:Beta-glucanase [Dactylellina cionopaga]|nr:Beta-glucanase [Dactylellina cionopaga]